MSDSADSSVEVLKQIRDGMLAMTAEVVGVRNHLGYVHDELIGTNRRLDRTNERLDQTVERLDQTVERLDHTNERLDETNERLDKLRGELKGEMAELRRTVIRVARVSDATLAVSLEDSGRMDAIEGRLKTLEAQVADLRERP